MSDLATGDRLAWIDIETTGLEWKTDRILEVGLMITDTELNWKGGWEFVIQQGPDAVRLMDNWALTTHTNNGLINLLSSGVPLSYAEAMLSGVIEQTFASPPLMCGSSVQFDRGFLEAYMPGLAAKFHYRMGDVSSLKEFAGMWCPDLDWSALPTPAKRHRVMPDLHDTVAEARFYRDRFFS